MMIPKSLLVDTGSIESSCKSDEERKIVLELTAKAESDLREGNLYYVISSGWFKGWQMYTGQTEGAYPFADRPGVIDNRGIVVNELDNKEDDPQLLRTLQEGLDYVLVPQEVWEKLFEWYKGGPPLPRKLISVADLQKPYTVELWPVCLRLVDSRDQTELILRLSKKASINDLYQKVCQLKGLQPDKVHIWDFSEKQKQTKLISSSRTLEECNLKMEQCILLEVSTDIVKEETVVTPRNMLGWAGCQDELLNLILSKLAGTDRLSFSLVCKNWNEVAASSPYRYSPCFMACRFQHRLRTYQYNTLLEDMSIPDLENTELKYSGYGWLLVQRLDRTLFFYDPSNNRSVELPCKVNPRCIGLYFYNPPTSAECAVVGIYAVSRPRICTLEVGEDAWNFCEFPDSPHLWQFCEGLSSIMHGGLIYFLTKVGSVALFDLKSREIVVYYNCLGLASDTTVSGISSYLVKMNGEEAFYGVFSYVQNGVSHLKFYRLSFFFFWNLVEQEDIADKVFYLSHLASFGYTAHTESMRNKIWLFMFHPNSRSAVYYSLKDDKYISVDGVYSRDGVYDLNVYDTGATWFMPMPVMEVVTAPSWINY